MADVVLNLVYNDNNAKKEIDGLVSQLQKLESRSYRIQFDRSSVPAFIKEIDNLTEKLNNIRKIDFRTIGAGIGYGASISGIERYIDKISDSILRARQRMDELAVEMSRLGGSGSEVDDLASQYDKLAQEVDKYKDQLAYAKKLHEELTSSHTSNIEQQISDTEKAAQEFEKAQEEKARSAREAAEKIKEAEIEITQGQHQMWRGVEQLVSGVINTITSGWNTFKSVVEAPMNLTGVSSLVSMLESLEGSLVLDQISSNITRGFSESVTRFDILRTFPEVMESIGFSGVEASDSMDRLYQSVLGLPTAFEDIVQTTQYFALVLDDLDKATQLSIAANNAFVASGATSQQITTGMRQLQYLIDGTKLRSTQWYSLIRSMPVALREVGVSLGYPDFTAFTADLMGGKIATDELIDSLIQVGTESPKIAGVIDTMKNRVQASLDNVANAARRMGTTILDALDTTLRRTGGKGISENIREFSSVLDHIAEVASKWIASNGDKIQALLDKFFAIDWASVVPSFFEGLLDFATNGLDNIGKYITDIGAIITSGRQFFNDIENSRIVKLLSGGSSFISGIAQSVAGIGNIIAGLKLTSIGKAILASMPGAAGAAGVSLPGWLTVGRSLAVIPFIQAAYQGLEYIGESIHRKDKREEENLKNNIQALLRLPRNVRNELLSEMSKFNDVSEKAYKDAYRASSPNVIEFRRLQRLFSSYGIKTYDPGDFNALRVAVPTNYELKLISDSFYPEIHGTEYELDQDTSIGAQQIFNRIKNRADLIKQIVDTYDAQISEIDIKITELQDKRQQLIDKINAAPPVLGRDFFKNLGLISDEYEKAEGKDYTEEAEDAEKFYTENLPKFQGWVKSVSDYISSLEEGETKNIAQEYFSALLSGFDVTDPDQLKYILETLGGKTPEQVVEDFLQQQAAAIAQKNWEDTINQYLADQLGLTIEEYEQQKDSLEKEKSSAIGFLLTGINEDFDELQEKYPEVLSYLATQNSALVKSINEALDGLDSSLAISNIDAYWNDVIREISQKRNQARQAMELPYVLPTAPGGQTAPYATGGFAPMGTDTIPAMLTPGEYVQRRAAVEHFGRQFMERINALDLRGALRSISMNYSTPYATGGFVRSDNRSYRDNHATVNQIFKSANASTGFRRASRFVRALG